MSDRFALSDETTARLRRWADEKDHLSRQDDIDTLVCRLATERLIELGATDVREREERIEELQQNARDFIRE